jgi:hypothetical protein
MKMPYENFEFKPGELITAERMNAMQDAIKGDIQGEIETASEHIKKTGVDKATNAEKFDAKTSKEWTDALDQRYSPKVHDHEGQAVYKRYFKQLRDGQTIVLEHKLGRFPIVDIYKLKSIVESVQREARSIDEDTKFYLYYHHEERDEKLLTEDRGMVRWPWGIPLEQLLTEYDVKWELDDSLGDVINDFLDAFFKPPAVDHMDHKLSPWIESHKEKSIGYLKKRDEWPDIRWVVKPEKVAFGPAAGTAGVASDRISVIHLSYDTLAVKAELTGQDSIDLMILLRS